MKVKMILGVAIAAGTLVSCSVDDADNAQVPVQESYTRDFIKTFGTINPNQDWNMAEQKSITVNTGSPTDVLIYEKQGGQYRLAADYKAVSGIKTILFDGLEGDDTPFIVSLNGNMVTATNGETVNYDGSSASGIERAAETSSWVTRNDSTTLTLSNTDKRLYQLTHKEGEDLSDLFELCTSTTLNMPLSEEEYTTLYPLYHGSNKSYEAGIYYYDTEAGTKIYVPFFKTGQYDDEYGELTGYDTKNRGGHIMSHGYTIQPSKSIIASIYVKSGDKIYYANPTLNNGAELFATSTHDIQQNDYYLYILFDDPEDNNGDKDFNDLIFMKKLGHASGTTSQAISYLVACEDLGGTFDYDFNDIVFRVSHAAGQDYLTITPVAAGGTLEAYLCYNGKVVSEEWHKHFGNGYDISKMINTGNDEDTNVRTIYLKGVPTDFSMTQFSTANSGFSIKVVGKEETQVAGPSNGEAPQMLILPNDWKWPRELTNILTTYPQFGKWGKNYTDPTWVNTITDGNYIDMKENSFKSTEVLTFDVTK